MEAIFPPELTIGHRVWTIGGYLNHGPLEGPKIDIVPNMGGTINATESPFSIGSVLYTVRWDNGQISKHYTNGLFCIGKFQTRMEFEAAIKIVGSVELTLGPQGGFRHAVVGLEYDGCAQKVDIHDRGLWVGCLERLARENAVPIIVIKLPGRSRTKSQT